MPEARKRPCAICRQWFRPDARIGSRQHACGKPECQTSRRQKTQASWRRRNPGYAIAYRIDQRAAQTESPPEPLRMLAPLNQLPWDVIGIGAAVTRRPLQRRAARTEKPPAEPTANAAPINPPPRGGDRQGGGAPPPPPATPPC